MGVSETGSVRVSSEAVENADYYTVSFSQAVGDDQEGLCRGDSHFRVVWKQSVLRMRFDKHSTRLSSVYVAACFERQQCLYTLVDTALR